MRFVAAVAAGVVLVVGGCGDDGGGAGGPTATFTGSGCDYEGPSEFEFGSPVTFTVSKTTDEEVGFSLWKVPDGTTSAEISEAGIFDVAGGDSFMRGAVDAEESGTTYELTADLNVAGSWTLNCFFDDGTEDWADVPAVVFTVAEE